MSAKATIDAISGTFTLVKEQWEGTYPIANLPESLAFYREQQARFPNHASSYDDVVAALTILSGRTTDNQSP
jgi:hypothetical protein